MRSQVGPVHIRTQAPESPGRWSSLRGKPGRAVHSNLPGPHSPTALGGTPPPLSLPLWFGRCWVHSVDMPPSFQIYWKLIFTLGKVAPEWPFISLPNRRDTFSNLLVVNWLIMWFCVTFHPEGFFKNGLSYEREVSRGISVVQLFRNSSKGTCLLIYLVSSVRFQFLPTHLFPVLSLQTWRFADSCTVLELEGPRHELVQLSPVAEAEF